MSATDRRCEERLTRAYAEHRDAVYRYLLHRTHDVSRAEDLTQDVFLAAVAASARLADGRPLLGWLYVVAQRRFADATRDDSRNQSTSLPLSEAATQEAPERAPRAAAALAEAIASLPPSQRVIVATRLLEGAEFAEISERIGVRERACERRFERGLETLRGLLEH